MLELQSLRRIVQDQGREMDSQRKEMVVLLQLLQEQSRETQELRLKSAALESSNAELRAQLELSLPALLQTQRPGPHAQKEDVGGVETPPAVIEEEKVEDTGAHIMSPRARYVARDFIDQCIQEYFANHPEFQMDVEKVKPGWYVFGEPISKKLYLKVSAEHVVCRVGGGHKDLVRFLDEHRHAQQDR